MQTKLTSAGGSPEWRSIQEEPKRSSHPLQQKLAKAALLLSLLAGATSATFAQNVFTPGVLREDYFTPTDGATGQGGLDEVVADYGSGAPFAAGSLYAATYWWNSFGPFKSGNNQGDSIGEVVTGYVIPPTTGLYEFYLRSDDPGELFINTTGTTMPNPSVDTPICLQTGCCNAFTSTEDGTLSSVPMTLTAGKKYPIMAVHAEGGGDDYIQIAWRTPMDTSLTNPPAGVIPAAYIGADAPSAGASVNITTPPANATVTEGSVATFTVAYTAKWNSAPPSFTNSIANLPANWPPTFALITSSETQDANAATDASIVWFKNGAPIAGESSATYTTPLLTKADSGASYTVQVSVPGASAMSAAATVTVNAKTTPPKLVKAAGQNSLAGVSVKFDSALDATTAATVANYTVSPSLTVTAAALDKSDPLQQTVILTTATQANGTKYTLTVSNVKDLSGNVIAANSTIAFYSAVFATGLCSEAYWGGQTSLAGFQAQPYYPNGTPNYSALLSDWEYPTYNGPWTAPASGNNEAGDNYGNIISGWFIPPTTGNYVFFTCSDDQSNLYLSTDDTPANKKLIAQEANWSNPRQWVSSAGGSDVTAKRSDQFSSTEWPGGNTITLTAGKKYWLEADHYEGGGGDNIDCTYIISGAADPKDNDASTLTGPVIGTTIPADGVLGNYGPSGADASPKAAVSATVITGLATLNSTTMILKVDGAQVAAKFSTNGSAATVSYTPSTPFAPQSQHTAELDYPLTDGSTATVPWSFTIARITTDTVSGNVALVKGTGGWTADKGGHSGQSGDYAIDSGKAGGTWVDIQDVSFINAAAVSDTLSVSLWIKKYDIANGSAFWAQLSKVTDGTDLRGFQSHIPWSDDNIYFDTMGCCDGALQRINANISTFPAYVNDGFWTNWHHFVYTKKLDQKNIYIDGQLFLNGSSTDPLQPNFVEMGLFTDGIPGGDFMHGIIDDFAVYSTEVSAADAAKLASGTEPPALTGETLVAYWPFNDPPAAAGSYNITSATVSGGNITITWTGGGTLQSASAVTGPWTGVPGKTSPAIVPASGTQGYFRISSQ
jgi:hypothetical protein